MQKFHRIYKIRLGNGIDFAEVSEQDYYELSKVTWNLYRNKEGYSYAIGRIKGHTVYMHRYILKLSNKREYVDHKNRDGLCNIRSNLRVCDNRCNQYNVCKKLNSKQKYKDIKQVSPTAWIVRMRVQGKRIEKRVHSEKDAVHLYNKLALKYHGSFANLIPNETKENVVSEAKRR